MPENRVEELETDGAVEEPVTHNMIWYEMCMVHSTHYEDEHAMYKSCQRNIHVSCGEKNQRNEDDIDGDVNITHTLCIT
jgi:hypothetical protein